MAENIAGAPVVPLLPVVAGIAEFVRQRTVQERTAAAENVAGAPVVPIVPMVAGIAEFVRQRTVEERIVDEAQRLLVLHQCEHQFRRAGGGELCEHCYSYLNKFSYHCVACGTIRCVACRQLD